MASPDKNHSMIRSFFGRFLPGSNGDEELRAKSAVSSNGRDPIPERLSNSERSQNGSLLSSTQSMSRNIRYISPTALESGNAQGSTGDSLLSSDGDGFSSRKRLHMDFDGSHVDSFLTGSDSIKRFRGVGSNLRAFDSNLGNRSYLPPPRLDTTWSGVMSGGTGSPSVMMDSPGGSSIRSLRSRISRAPSNASALSSRTAAILGQIEKISTPAQEARRMPLLRMGMEKERWDPLPRSSPNAPPLQRLSQNMPTRASIISSAHKKPYWRDLSRRQNSPQTSRESEVITVDESPSATSGKVSSVPVVLSPLFDVGTEKTTPGKTNGDHHRTPVSVLKGPDGKDLNRGKNRFSARELDEEDNGDTGWMDGVRGISEEAAPKAGFLLTNTIFAFPRPTLKTDVEEVDEEEEEAESVEESGGESNDEESSDDKDFSSPASAAKEPVEVTASSDTSTSDENVSDTRAEEKDVDGKKENDPQSKVPSASIVPLTTSSTFSSPSSAITKTNGFGSSLAASATTGFSFDSLNAPASISSSSPQKPEGTSSVLPAVGSGRKPWDCPECMVNNKVTDNSCVCCGHVMYKEESARSEWDCPECFIHNKGEAAKCIACGNQMYKEDTAAASFASVFGDKAFKPVAPPTGVSFGFGGNSSSVSGGVSFGFGSTSVAKSATPGFPAASSPPISTAPLAISTPSVVPSSFGLTPPEAAPAAVAAAPAPLFGSSSAGGILFGNSSKTAVSSSTATAPVPSLSAATPLPSAVPLAFGSSEGQKSWLPPSSSLSIPPSSSSALMPSAPSQPLFGSNLKPPLFPTTSSAPTLFSVSSAVPNLLSSAPPPPSSTLPSSSSTLFGSMAAPATSSAAIPPFSFGKTPAAAPAFHLGGAPLTFPASKPPAPTFGQFPGAPEATSKSDDGPEAKRSFNFGGSSAAPSFGSSNASTLFGSSSTAIFGQSAPAASPAVFGNVPGAPPAVAEPPSFGAISAPPSTFQFGASAAPSSGGIFQFGAVPSASPSAAPLFGAAPTAPLFGSSTALSFPVPGSTAPAGDTSIFAYNSGAPSHRPKALAKRRMGSKTTR